MPELYDMSNRYSRIHPLAQEAMKTMPDQTTARDRAIEVVQGAALGPIYAGQSTASNVIDALLARPEVLRALAGAPTADAAALLAACDDLDRRSRQRVGEIERGERHGPPIWRQLSTDEIRRLLKAAPAAEPEGMDVEAQGEMADELDRVHAELDEWEAMRNEWRDKAFGRADELAAAQAAIQRVQDVADEYERGTKYGRNPTLVQVAARLRRALDGDTTEEA